MHPTRHPVHHLVSLVGTGLMLAGLFGCLNLPADFMAGIESTAYRDDRDYWGRRGDRSYRKPGYGLPDRYTIHKGKKCQLRCERVRGTRDYRCREYRC